MQYPFIPFDRVMAFLNLPSTTCRRVVALRNVVWNGSAVMNEEPHSSRRRREQRDFAEAKYRIVYVLIFMRCVSNLLLFDVVCTWNKLEWVE